ncbi:MAG: phosphatidylserine/phosphatidylglycerophosphate/cardiolipin synthase family protein [bacterium]|nr:phosphatidylserine/phosphatidylglycerophosphate/cardiolipin synthase family protein [bacterium]
MKESGFKCLRKVLFHPTPSLGFMLLVVICMMSSCAATPDADKVLDNPPVTGAAKVTGPRGALTAAESRELLKDIGATEALRRHLTVEQAIAESPLVEGNSTRMLRDGKQAFSAIFAAIEAAQHHINLEYYILEDIQWEGKFLSEALIRKRRQGVDVHVIYDSFGSSNTPPAFFDKLKKGGVKILEFNPINPLEAKKGYEPLDRDHRKILVVDGKVAILGGINLSATYQSSGKGKSGAAEGHESDYWHDTDIEIRGPAVAQIQKLFALQWTKQKGGALDDSTFYPKLGSQGSELIRMIGSTPDKEIPRYYVTLISAIRSAQKNIWITAAYFFPTEEQVDDLIAAAKAGIDVRVIVPDKSDAGLAISMQHKHYSKLLKGGVRLWETHGVVQHSKTVTVDGVWSVVGSSNIDQRSVVFNDESDIVIVGEKTAAEMEAIFTQDGTAAEEITLKKWKKRPIGQKFKDAFMPLWLGMFESSL